MHIINATPYPITIVDDNGNITRKIFPCGKTIRLKADTVRVDNISIPNVPISKTVFSWDANDLPPVDPQVFFIVSQMVKSAFPNRTDLLVPAEVVRDKDGKIIGCKSLGI